MIPYDEMACPLPPPWQPRRSAGAILPVHENPALALSTGMALPPRNKLRTPHDPVWRDERLLSFLYFIIYPKYTGCFREHLPDRQAGNKRLFFLMGHTAYVKNIFRIHPNAYKIHNCIKGGKNANFNRNRNWNESIAPNQANANKKNRGISIRLK